VQKLGFAMGIFRSPGEQDAQENTPLTHEEGIPPKDLFHLAYISYFIMGAGFLLPWNAFITAVDYFTYIYPGKQVDTVFSVAYMIPALVFIVLLLTFAGKSNVRIRINLGLSLFLLSLLVVPVMDVAYIKGQRGLDVGYSITVAAVVLCGISDALVQGSLIGSAGELPEQYMQAVVAGTAASGVLVSALRILTKAALPQNVHGLRTSANLYFAVSIVFMALCLVCYNMASRLPVIMYYNDLKIKTRESTFLLGNTTVNSLADPEDRSLPDGASVELYGACREGEGMKFWHVLRKIKWFALGILLIYLVTLSIFPGYITEDVHSHLLKDWYPILLITGYNIFDLVGKSLTAYLMLESAAIAIGGSVARLLFFPLFYFCLHGPHFFHTEIPVVFLTCLLGLTNGYFTSVVMIIAPKTVPLQESETAGITIVLFLVIGLAMGSIVAWFWVI